MQHLGRLALMSCFCVLISGQLDDSKFSERPYDVLQNQNLVILGSVFGILLVIMVTMAVCVYKPLPRR
uniref:Si:dkey-234h16.7 n=1 Tax=Gadus morhua TaxID=8049 RepID=A0A8C5CQ87_GADMO